MHTEEGKGGGGGGWCVRISLSEFQNPLFCILTRTPCPCWYFIAVFLLALIKVSIHLVWFVTISFALCHHFNWRSYCLFKFYPQQLTGLLYNSLTSLALNWIDTFPPGRGTPSLANLAWAAWAFFCRWKSELT